MKLRFFIFTGLIFLLFSCKKEEPVEQLVSALRAPAFPLITIDGYANGWSCSDNLYESPVRQQAGRTLSLMGVLRVDSKSYRFMGMEEPGVDSATLLPLREPKFPKTAVQKSVSVLPTQTIYDFICGAVDLRVIFTAPLLMDNLDLMARPVNYVSYEVTSYDDCPHDVEIYLEVGTDNDAMVSGQNANECLETDNLLLVRRKKNSFDDARYLYLAAAKNNCSVVIDDDYVSLRSRLGKVTQGKGHFILGYDDNYFVQFFGDNLRPFWQCNKDADIIDQFVLADKEYETVRKQCEAFDRDLMTKAASVGGKCYAELCALAYRQAVSAHKAVQSPEGNLLFLSEENYSVGPINLTDVAYSSSPLFLLYNVELAKGLLNHIFYCKTYEPEYCTNMSAEASGNILILAAAIASKEGHADMPGNIGTNCRNKQSSWLRMDISETTLTFLSNRYWVWLLTAN